MKDQPVSPAVVSLISEQADQAFRRKTQLDKGLEDTFPASDPVSVTQTATATGIGSTAAEPHPTEALGLHPLDETFPLVDDALKAVEERHFASSDVYLDEVQAMRRDVAGLAHRIGALAGGAGRIARAEVDGLQHRLYRSVRDRPILTLGLVAAAAFVMGSTRRPGRDG